MKACVKYETIYCRRKKYSILAMCKFFGVSRSGYYNHLKHREQPHHDAGLAKLIAECQSMSKKTYDYRCVQMWLVRKKSLYFNRKTVLRVMNKYGLLSEIRCRKKYKQMGQQVHKYENLPNRNFVADRPNVKWVTDISYIHTAQGVLYLSIIRDLYDNSIVAHRTGTQQTVNLVLKTIQTAREKEKIAGKL